MVLLISCLAVDEASAFHTRPRFLDTENMEEACPPCELLFSRLERTVGGVKLSQSIHVQERGEPKSGTGILFFWATAALIHACNYLQEQFGEKACITRHPRTVGHRGDW